MNSDANVGFDIINLELENLFSTDVLYCLPSLSLSLHHGSSTDPAYPLRIDTFHTVVNIINIYIYIIYK